MYVNNMHKYFFFLFEMNIYYLYKVNNYKDILFLCPSNYND